MTFTPIGRSAEARPDETLLDVARRATIPLGNSCGGIGVCKRCRVEVLSGVENVSPPTSMEVQRGFTGEERMACQAVVLGDCEITTGYW